VEGKSSDNKAIVCCDVVQVGLAMPVMVGQVEGCVQLDVRSVAAGHLCLQEGAHSPFAQLALLSKIKDLALPRKAEIARQSEVCAIGRR
jgi:hypothetical protein